jgi:hypothetical protein
VNLLRWHAYDVDGTFRQMHPVCHRVHP